MVADTVLGEIIGADPPAAVTGADLSAAVCGNLLGLCLLRLCQKAAAQDLEGTVFILVLTALVLTLHHHTGGKVGNTNGGFGLIDMLTTRAAGAEGIYF